VDWAGLSLPKLLDQDDTLLQLRFALLELLDLLNDRVEARRFVLRGGDLGVELSGLV
jgi:hypothetical protein